MDLTRTIRQDLTADGKSEFEKDGWVGPVSPSEPRARNLLHNVRYWHRPRGGVAP